MKNIIKHIVSITVIILPYVNFAQTNFYKASWEDVVLKAKTENKLIFVDLYFTGCFPCAQMDKTIFPNEKVSQLLNQDFVAFKSDIFKEDIGKRLARKYGVTGFPSFVILDSKGNTIDVNSGFKSVEELLSLLNAAKERFKTKDFKSYSKALNIDYPEFYSDAYLKNKRKVSFEVVDSYLKSQKDLNAEIPFVIITGLRIGGEYVDYVISHADKLAKAYGRIPVRNYLSGMVNVKAKHFGTENNQKEFENLLKQVKPIFTTNEWDKFGSDFKKTFEKNKQL
ncbi:thioredoxin family protein [Aestuariibaculum marinum]|uniref:Thioredoxin family protein n=1 Tax=Aestuariibaculum marinum TaxID=2683592 RepID=A0A8J6Q4R7_9FLAO|nr:thioredoxin family protein [Aestuariibaculum marinum]MBD0824897.1 thioredoxin family protein [Aestuariibaculum marinum]